ncbi:MAG: restriction endonuclease [Nanoarchaeota archaeon]|nr:restriction endonuclease [Nanoarchaeota archaeon]
MKDHHYDYIIYLLIWILLISFIFLFNRWYINHSIMGNIFLITFIAIIINLITFKFIKNLNYKALFDMNDIFGRKQLHQEFEDINNISLTKINEGVDKYLEIKNYIYAYGIIISIILLIFSAIISFYWILIIFLIYVFIKYYSIKANVGFLLDIRYEKEKLENKKFEEAQIKKGLVKFGNKWGTPHQIKEWKKVKYGIKSNFMNMSHFQFEEFIAKLFRKMGYNAEVTKRTGDYGVDIIARGKGDKIAIQVKHNKIGNNVGNITIQKALGATYTINANKVIVITTSDFTRQAREQTRSAPIKLWNLMTLKQMVGKYFIDADDDIKQEDKKTNKLREKLDKEDIDKGNYDLSDIPIENKDEIKEQIIAERMERESRLK